MIYYDTAYIVKCYLHEPGCEPVRSLLKKHRSAACCALGRIEFSTTIHRAVRERKLDQRVLDTVFEILDSDEQFGVWQWLPLTANLMAATFAKLRNLPSNVPLRAGDALHLECARAHGFNEIYSNDRHLIAAAPHFGLQAVNLIV